MSTSETPTSQALFEALFNHAPKTDTRTPAGVAADKAAGWPVR